MTNHAISFGIALIIVGLYGYFGYDAKSLTALIPAAVGIVLFLSGIIGANPARRKHAMHLAATASLLGAIAAWGRLGMVLSQGKDVNLMILMMGILCTLFVVLCVLSFRAARKAREGDSTGG